MESEDIKDEIKESGEGTDSAVGDSKPTDEPSEETAAPKVENNEE